MPLSEDDVNAVANAVVHQLTTNPPPFWLKAEEHYNDHRTLGQFIKWWNRGVSIIGTIVLVAVFSGVVLLFSLGFKR